MFTCKQERGNGMLITKTSCKPSVGKQSITALNLMQLLVWKLKFIFQHICVHNYSFFPLGFPSVGASHHDTGKTALGPS